MSWQWDWPNALLYPLTLLGLKFWLGLPGLGLVGLIAALRCVPRSGERGMAGRFAVAALAVTLAVYLPYFWQAIRFMLVPGVLLNTLAAAVLVPRCVRLWERWKARSSLQRTLPIRQVSKEGAPSWSGTRHSTLRDPT